VIVVPSRRHYDKYIVVPSYRHRYPYYRPIYVDKHFWGWLAFTAITLRILDYLNEDQRRQHELAMYRASQANIGDTIYWADSDRVTGSVTPVWEGPSNTGQYCREYRNEVTIGDQTEVAYGTACRMPDGTWEVVH
jgi:surface antigen